MERRSRISGFVFALLSCATLCAAAHPALAQDPTGTQTYLVRARSGGATIRNFQDRQGLAVRELRVGGLMRVHAEDVGFLDVEALGGLEVWVFGEYLETTADREVLRVTASGVNMRPRSGASTANMPIRTKLQRGDSVRFIERADPNKPFEEDWVRVWSPTRARGWVLASETERVPDAAAARAQWEKATGPRKVKVIEPAPKKPVVAESRNAAATKPAPRAPQASGGSVSVPTEALNALREADQLYDSARVGAGANYSSAIALYRRVLELAPADSAAAIRARYRLDEVEARAEYERLQKEVVEQERVRGQRLSEIQRENEVENLRGTANWGRFHSRGWLEPKTIDGQIRYFLRWGGEYVSEVACSSKRYDLELFEGYELGIMGSGGGDVIVPGAAGSIPRVRAFDVYRIEVISGSDARR